MHACIHTYMYMQLLTFFGEITSTVLMYAHTHILTHTHSHRNIYSS
jgi:hypothetical protein